MEAIEVDMAVLNIPSGGETADAGSLRKKNECLSKTPHTWVRSTEDNVNSARHWVTDSARCARACVLFFSTRAGTHPGLQVICVVCSFWTPLCVRARMHEPLS
jgi:hypothetical protein